MDFTFTAEQEMLRDSVARYLGDHYEFAERQAMVRSAEGWRPEDLARPATSRRARRAFAGRTRRTRRRAVES